MADQLSSDLASLRIDRTVDPNRRGPFGYIVILVVVAAAGAAAWLAGLPYLEANVFKREVAVTEITMVSPANASTDLTTTGYVTPQKVSQVAAKVFGKVSRVLVKQGQVVNEGDLLIELDAIDQEATVAAAEARVAAARARAAAAMAGKVEAERQAKRARSLAEGEVGSKATAEDLESRVESLAEQARASQAEVKAVQAEVAALRVGLKNHKVAAPISGTVISRPPEVGENLGMMATGLSSQGGTIEIADLTSLVVETDVPEQRLHLIQMGRPAEIVLDAFPTRRYRGKAVEIVPRMNRAKATATVKVAFTDPTDGVLPDMSARVSFLSKELDEASLKQPAKRIVPTAAVVDRNNAKVVFVIEGDRVRVKPVQIAAPSVGSAGSASGFELLDGPAPGTRVVRDPPADLADGQLVKEKADS
ncbi:MAG TPA: efflux RND transporter periplasmic adaptor subunit [Polyangiaceae bacterium]|jgi:RND family efflux transporter MFP subunit|nr:efflux RND transporter periplasmic adaptor subunit [Polyangiaceae bacterium]